jgi:hypothetical protein
LTRQGDARELCSLVRLRLLLQLPYRANCVPRLIYDPDHYPPTINKIREPLSALNIAISRFPQAGGFEFGVIPE